MGNGGFNPLDIVENLQNAGVPEEQAKVHARALSQVSDHTAATKQDLEVTKLELKHDIELVKKEIESIRRDIKSMGNAVIVKLTGIIAALLAMFRFLPEILK